MIEYCGEELVVKDHGTGNFNNKLDKMPKPVEVILMMPESHTLTPLLYRHYQYPQMHHKIVQD